MLRALPLLAAAWLPPRPPLPTAPPLLRRPHPPARMADDPPPPRPGYYARPSAAFEQGGGFFVPGLEGKRLRLAAAALLAAGLALNRALSPAEPAASQLGSEALGLAGLALLLLQLRAQTRHEAKAQAAALRAALAARVRERREVGERLAAPRAEAGVWAAQTLLRLTDARAVVWVGGGELLLRLGRFPQEAEADVAAGGVEELWSALGAAESAEYEVGDGEAACFPLPSNSASALLQRCGGDGMLVLASERPAAFNAKHRRWLASMAAYLEGVPAE
ncbi:hypothetical protein AB1Y20_015810 [Prymnesium parvum]|uniref:Uncharacterized protein n=1 Tax=Prymnesium parvum TaxID=97485 RepID=A0AB34K1I5_PRYPA